VGGQDLPGGGHRRLPTDGHFPLRRGESVVYRPPAWNE
jgi:hypothetical protein